MRSFVSLLLIPAALLLATPYGSAAGRRPSTQQAQERLAKKACLAGDPAKGVEVLAELYVETDDITYIFNQGRCLEQNRRYEDAIARFREYLLKGENKLSDEDKADARKHIETCESYLPKPEPRVPLAPQPVQAAPVDRAPSPAVGVAGPSTLATAAKPQRPEGNPGSGLRIAGIVVGSLGIVALGTGVALNIKANSMASDLEKPESFDRETDSTRKDYKLLSGIGYGTGAAFVAGGVVLYYLGWRAGQRSAQANVVVVPTLVAGAAGASLAGGF